MTSIFTFSTDDGHPSDIKMAGLLSKHCLNGTFFIPINNCERMPVMRKPQILEISRQFEIGSHTFDHYYLTNINSKEAKRQIINGKKYLEDFLDKTVAGFCYPGGKFRKEHMAMVQSAGFEYARTTMNLRFDVGHSRFEIPTSIQFYPHPKSVYLRNFVKAGSWNKRTNGLLLALQHDNWIERLYALFDYSCQQEKVFHMWAHSSDIDNLNAWSEIDRFFGYVAKKVAMQNRLNNQQLVLKNILQVQNK